MRRQAGMMRHVNGACRDRARMAEHHVERCDRSCRRAINHVVRTVLQKQRHHRLEVRAGNERETIVLEHSPEFLEGDWNLMGMKMFQAMRRPDGIEALRTEMVVHIRHRSHNVRLDRGIEIHADLLPVRGVEHCVRPANRPWPRADIEHATYFCLARLGAELAAVILQYDHETDSNIGGLSKRCQNRKDYPQIELVMFRVYHC